jgi:hypothetical protein
MKTKLLLTIILAVCGLFASAQITFQKIYEGGSGLDNCRSVQQTTDGGYIIAGTTRGSFGEAAYLIKTDSTGDTLWTKTFGSINYDAEAHSVQQTRDGGYIMAGMAGSYSADIYNMYIIKTDGNGDTLWTRTLGQVGDERAYSVQQTTDGGFIVGGHSEEFGGGGSNDICLSKLDSTGTLLWMKKYGGGTDDYCYSVQQTSDGGYIAAGYTGSFGPGGIDVYVIKTDSNGDTLWTKTYGDTGCDYAESIQQTSDGGYIITGCSTGPNCAAFLRVYLLKIDANGSLLWAKTYGRPFDHDDEGWSVRQTTDGGYIIAGCTRSSTQYDYYLIKTDSTGTLLWSKAYGGANDENGYSVQQTTDGGYIIAGFAVSFGGGIYLIKTDSMGNSGCNETNPATNETSSATIVISPATVVFSPSTSASFPAVIVGSGGLIYPLCTTVGISEIAGNASAISVYPNPFVNEVKIKGTKENGKAALYDLTGKEILHETTLQGETKLNTAKVAEGFYILHYIEGNRAENIKVTKM